VSLPPTHASDLVAYFHPEPTGFQQGHMQVSYPAMGTAMPSLPPVITSRMSVLFAQRFVLDNNLKYLARQFVVNGAVCYMQSRDAIIRSNFTFERLTRRQFALQ
jgi:hypothetical protein